MKLSIVTINYNNAAGLKKTLESVASQQLDEDFELEHIIVDGASTDGSVEIAKDYQKAVNVKVLYTEGRASKAGAKVRVRVNVRVVSEKDNGIYNAMNKGIRMATGDYCQFLNSGDMLAGTNVISSMTQALNDNNYPDIIYGGMTKVLADGHRIEDHSGGGTEYTLMSAYHGCLNHSPAYIRRTLFDRFGLYDETLKICSDWKWYLQTIVLGGVQAVYVPITVTVFDMGGISETRKDILEEERTCLLKELIPAGILHDYDKHYFDMVQMDNLRKHPWAYKLVWFLERILNRLDNKNFKPLKR